MAELTVNDLFQIIGRKESEIYQLRKELAAAQTMLAAQRQATQIVTPAPKDGE